MAELDFMDLAIYIAHYRGLVLNRSTYRDADSGYPEATAFYYEE